MDSQTGRQFVPRESSGCRHVRVLCAGRARRVQRGAERPRTTLAAQSFTRVTGITVGAGRSAGSPSNMRPCGRMAHCSVFKATRTVGSRTMADPPFVSPARHRRRGRPPPRRRAARRRRADIHWVTSVASALAALAEHPHDAVLIDAALAGDDGDTLRTARGGPARAGDRCSATRAAPPPSAPRARSAPSTTCRTPTLDADTLERARPLRRRPPALGRAPPPRRAARRAHRAAEPHAVPRPPGAVAAPRAPARRRTPARPSCSSTSTASRSSTTRSATRPATSCCRPSRSGWTRRCAPATPSRAWAATSSPCCWRTSPTRARRPSSPSGCSPRCPTRSRSPGASCSSRARSASPSAARRSIRRT